MNWSVPELENRALVSFSDAHSAANVGRELTVFEMEPTYDGLRQAINSQSIAETIELQVGSDLQYIRINGTLVGALIGAALFLIATGISQFTS